MENSAFEKLKKDLRDAPVPAFPMRTGELILGTDASGEAIGAVLSQRTDEGVEKVISYFSK